MKPVACAQVSQVPPDGSLFPLSFTRTVQCAPNCDTVPFYAEIDLPAGGTDERVNLHIRLFNPDLAAGVGGRQRDEQRHAGSHAGLA